MVIGRIRKVRKQKNKRKSSMKKPVSNLEKKDWYPFILPKPFQAPSNYVLRTCMTRITSTNATKDPSAGKGKDSGKGKATDGMAKTKQIVRTADSVLRGRQVSLNANDVWSSANDFSHVKFKFIIVKTTNASSFLQFRGMCFTTDKVTSLAVRKTTMINTIQDVNTLDGLHLRLFGVFVTKRPSDSTRQDCYVKGNKQRRLRKLFTDIITDATAHKTLTQILEVVMSDQIATTVEAETKPFFMFQTSCIWKIKMISKKVLPNISDELEDLGIPITTPEGSQPTNPEDLISHFLEVDTSVAA
eukprot:GHVN01047509.1.p1 GENE.GHVN01047509.1~~GHVN01047509.1.p1  ORF type:complete len:301 (+),score=30.30 GHVN01047509.1:30-932(+)